MCGCVIQIAQSCVRVCGGVSEGECVHGCVTQITHV